METQITVNRNQSGILRMPSSTDEAPPTDERRAAINWLIIAAHAGYGSAAPEGDSMSVAVEVWKDALDEAGAPTDQLRSLLKKCLAGRGSNYPPGVSEICEEWRRYLIALPRQTIQEADAEKLRALPQRRSPLVDRGRELHTQMQARFAANKGNVQCECGMAAVISADYFDWICDAQENPCGFRWPVAKTLDAPIGKGKPGPMGSVAPESAAESAPAEQSEYSDAELLALLASRCEFAVPDDQRDFWIEFARYLKAQAPPSVWTRAMASGIYHKWQSSQGAAVTA